MILSNEECPARYQFSGLFQTDEVWIHPTRRIDTYEILLALAGRIHLFEEDRQYTLQPGDVLVLRPSLLHGGWKKSEGETSFYWIHFHDASQPPADLPYAPHSVADPSRLHLLCRQLLHIANAGGYPAYAVQAAFSLLYCELRQLFKETDACTRLVAETAEWIRIHSQKRLSVEQVAQRTGYHPDYLSTLFKATYHLSLKQYINKERMNKIRSLLLTTSDPIKQIAAKMDFGSEEQLVHYFRYHEGISPAKYRNIYHHTHLNRA